MKVKDVMETDVVFAGPDETVSSALSKMKRYRLHQLPVIGKELEGMLLLKTIITKDVDPSNTKVSSVMSHATAADKEDNIRRAAELVIVSGSRALPVVERGKVIGIISETDIMKVLGQFNLNYAAAEIMTPCEFVNKGDNIGKVKNIMLSSNISRVPVVENEKIIGVVGTVDLIDAAMSGKQKMQGAYKRQATKESASLEKMTVDGMTREAVVIDKRTRMDEMAKILLDNEEVFVEDNGIYIVTPKDIVELVSKSGQQGAYVQITNLKGEDSLVVAKIEEKAAELVKKVGHTASIQSFAIHIDRHEKGGKPRYDVRTRLFISSAGLFVSKSSGWHLVTIVQEAVDKLEREIMKKHDMVSHHEKAKKSRLMKE